MVEGEPYTTMVMFRAGHEHIFERDKISKNEFEKTTIYEPASITSRTIALEKRSANVGDVFVGLFMGKTTLIAVPTGIRQKEPMKR